MGVVLASPWANLGTITSAFWASVFSAENLRVCSSGCLQLFKFVNKAQMSAFPFSEDLHLKSSSAAERVNLFHVIYLCEECLFEHLLCVGHSVDTKSLFRKP